MQFDLGGEIQEGTPSWSYVERIVKGNPSKGFPLTVFFSPFFLDKQKEGTVGDMTSYR